MNVLVLGGTVFFGRHLVDALLARGHRVTTFNRGLHAVDGDLRLTRITGDRTRPDDLQRIPPTGWDAVIDPSSDVPGDVAAAAAHVRSAGRYVYISSISVYELGRTPVDETSRTIADPGGDPDAATAEAFGWRKAASEARVAEAFGRRATLIRPGLIAGPYDPSDRFTYWAVRIARGGNVLVPGPPERRVQFIDVRDLAAFVVHAVERELAGVFNVTSARDTLSMRDLVDACREDGPGLPAIHWLDGAFLAAHGCTGWSDLPLWIPAGSPYPGIFDVDTARAQQAGLVLRPIGDTVRATRAWFAQTGRTSLRSGLEPQRETELLDSWNAAISF